MRAIAKPQKKLTLGGVIMTVVKNPGRLEIALH